VRKKKNSPCCLFGLVPSFGCHKRSLIEVEQIQAKNVMILKTGATEMETVEQTKVALTPFDDKRIWHSIHESEPYGMSDAAYDADEVFDRIVTNCARRVEIGVQKFKDLLGCALTQFRSRLEDSLPSNCSFMNYGTIWNIDHIDCVSKEPLTEERVAVLCNYANLRPLLVEENSRKGARY
jgi:hypothetical protein